VRRAVGKRSGGQMSPLMQPGLLQVARPQLLSMYHLPFGDLLSRPFDVGARARIGQQLQGVLQRLQILGADQDSRWPTIPRQDNAFVVSFYSIHYLGQMGLDFGQRQRVTHDQDSSQDCRIRRETSSD
jgi:hypothetical protein